MKVLEAKKITEGLTNLQVKCQALVTVYLPGNVKQVQAGCRKVKGSVCASCYALKGNYTRYPAIKAAQYRRLEAMKNPPGSDAMITVIKRQKSVEFRWHDSGDVQDEEHLNKIFAIAGLHLQPTTGCQRGKHG